MNKERDILKQEEKKEVKKGKHRIIIAEMLAVLSLTTIALTIYTLCYTCITLYNTGHVELCAAIITGVIFMYVICGSIGLFLIAWRELKGENRL